MPSWNSAHGRVAGIAALLGQARWLPRTPRPPRRAGPDPGGHRPDRSGRPRPSVRRRGCRLPPGAGTGCGPRRVDPARPGPRRSSSRSGRDGHGTSPGRRPRPCRPPRRPPSPRRAAAARAVRPPPPGRHRAVDRWSSIRPGSGHGSSRNPSEPRPRARAPLPPGAARGRPRNWSRYSTELAWSITDSTPIAPPAATRERHSSAASRLGSS